MRTRPGVEKSRGVSRVRRRVSMLESSGHGKGVVGPLEKFFLLSSKTEQSNKEGEGGQNGDLFSYDIDAMKRKNAEMYRYFLVVQFLTKVDFVLKRYEYLLLEEEISLLRTLKKMSLESTVLLARLSVRKRSWIRLLKNDYADIPSCFEVVQKLIEINVLEESFCIEDIVPLLESSRLRSLTLESNYLKREELEIKAIQFLKTQRTLSGEYIVFKDVRCIRIRPDVRELLRKVDYLFFMNYKYSFITIHPASYVCPAELKSSEQLDKDVAARSITFDSAECECVEESGFSERSKSDTWSLYISELMNKLDVVKRNVAAIESVEVFRIFKTREEFLRYMRFSDRAVNFAETLGLIGHWGSEWLSSDSINLKALRSREDEIVAIIQESVTDHKKFLHSLDTICLNSVFIENPFLSRYLPESINMTVIWTGIRYLEKKKNYLDASNYLELLLSQNLTKLEWRGKWWVRLVIDLKHLDKNLEAMKAAHDGLLDPHCRLHIKMKLDMLFCKLFFKSRNIFDPCSTAAKRGRKRRKVEACSIIPTSSSPIYRGMHDESPSKSSTMIWEELRKLKDARDELVNNVFFRTNVFREKKISLCTLLNELGPLASELARKEGSLVGSVEEYARRYYMKVEGWKNGVHSENGIFLTLFGILFWDILFDVSVPFSFLSPVQIAPVDLNTPFFYSSRKGIVDERLRCITDLSFSLNQLSKIFSEKHGEGCIGVDWYSWSYEGLREIIQCLGGRTLSIIFERMAKDYRHTRSGFPDLLLWDVCALKAKLVEVKGPGDKLSEKQIVWLNILARENVDVEVLYIRREKFATT